MSSVKKLLPNRARRPKNFSSLNLRNYPDEVKKCYILRKDLSDITQIDTIDNLKVKIKTLKRYQSSAFMGAIKENEN
jgi:hypothetical protein